MNNELLIEGKATNISNTGFQIDTQLQEAASVHPFIDFYYEDKSKYRTAASEGYIDPDNDFLIGDSGGFLLNINFKFVNTDLLKPAANYYKKYKKYTHATGPRLKDFRIQEEYRRLHGYSAKCKLIRGTNEPVDLRITGAHYNYINYSPILKLDEDSVKINEHGVSTGRKEVDFPQMFESQYWYFKIKEFARNNGFNTISCKTRRAGFSYCEATDTANSMNLTPERVYIHVANDNKYLVDSGGLTTFTYKQLVFYELNTPFKRNIASHDLKELLLGYKYKDGTRAGWNTSLLSLSCNNNPECAVGKDAGEVKCEEASTFSNFDEFYDVTEPTLRTGSTVTATLSTWGTGGSRSGKWQTFESNFYNPKSIRAMPFENVWDKDARHELCGFFKPYIWCLQGTTVKGEKSVDKDGNPNFRVAIEINDKERAEKFANKKNFAEYVQHCGQYANNPAESFNSVSSNIFSSKELDDWIEKLKHSTDILYHDGMFYEEVNGDKTEVKFKTNIEIQQEGGKYNKDYYDYIVNVPRKSHEHPHGCVRRFAIPLVDQNGKIPEGLYSATYDPVGVDKENKEITNKHSHNSISIWMNPHYLNNYKSALVCKFYGRPEKLSESDDIFFLMCRYYNVKGEGLVEVNRGETVSNARLKKCTYILQKEPVAVWDVKAEQVEGTRYGITISSDTVKLDAVRLFAEELYTKIGEDIYGNPILVLHTIKDMQSLLELKRWNSDGGNFDRVSEMILRGVQVKNRDIKNKNSIKNRRHTTERDIDNPLKRSWYK